MDSYTATLNSAAAISAAHFLALNSRCPDCHAQPLAFGEAMVFCRSCKAEFPSLDGTPVLIRHDNLIFPLESFVVGRRQALQRRATFSRLIFTPSVNLSFEGSLLAFKEALKRFDQSYVLVIGSGKQRERLEYFFPRSGRTTLVCCDVDLNASVDLFCDGHELPFGDGVFQGIIATAVLQHVLHPERVATEMFRVLAIGSVIYSEVAFMQQVCEGAYDFTRYSLTGHRILLRNFRELSAGVVAGRGTALLWAVENFALSFAEKQPLRLAIKAVLRSLLFWIKYFDYFLRDSPAAVDAASCAYFLGTKDSSGETSEQFIVDRYLGRKQLRHT